MKMLNLSLYKIKETLSLYLMESNFDLPLNGRKWSIVVDKHLLIREQYYISMQFIRKCLSNIDACISMHLIIRSLKEIYLK